MPEHSPVIWITGAAGGLGRGLVQGFLDAGWKVAATYHRSALPLEFESEQVLAVPLDVSQPHQVEASVAAIQQRWGRLDALINNAGLAVDETVWSLSEAAWDTVVDTNLKGAFFCSQAAARVMAAGGGGNIIHIGSFSARSGPAGQSNYAASKAGLVGLAQSLARELAESGIRVNVILPGLILTGMTSGLSEKRLQELAAANALRRLNSIPEVARFATFLVTMQNVSGQVFQLDSRIAPWT